MIRPGAMFPFVDTDFRQRGSFTRPVSRQCFDIRTFFCLPSLGLRPNARSRACCFDWSSKPCSATEGDHSVSHPPCVAAPAKRLALCQCVNARLLDSRQDSDANNGLLFWVQVSLLDRRGAQKEQPGERFVERLSFPKNKTHPSLPVQA